jgi:hypothetical protein
MNQTELFQFSFKIVGYSLIFVGSIWFSLLVQFGFFAHPYRYHFSVMEGEREVFAVRCLCLLV